MTTIEIKAIKAMAEIFGNKYTLQPTDIVIHGSGYLMSFKLSSGEEFFVKVYDDNSKPKVFRLIN
jgi:hypothetical protein